MDPLLFFLLLFIARLSGAGAGGQGVWTQGRVAALKGGSVSMACHYSAQYKDSVKYWCRGLFWSSCIVLQRTDSKQRRAGLSITDDPAQQVFTVTMSNLQVWDSNRYWCGVKIKGIETPDPKAGLILSVSRVLPTTTPQTLVSTATLPPSGHCMDCTTPPPSAPPSSAPTPSAPPPSVNSARPPELSTSASPSTTQSAASPPPTATLSTLKTTTPTIEIHSTLEMTTPARAIHSTLEMTTPARAIHSTPETTAPPTATPSKLQTSAELRTLAGTSRAPSPTMPASPRSTAPAAPPATPSTPSTRSGLGLPDSQSREHHSLQWWHFLLVACGVLLLVTTVAMVTWEVWRQRRNSAYSRWEMDELDSNFMLHPESDNDLTSPTHLFPGRSNQEHLL